MPNTKINNTKNISQDIMSKIKEGEIEMKPRWYFVVGSVFSITGLVGLSVASVFLFNLALFLVRHQGRNSQMRLEMILGSFPLWLPLLAIVGTMFGIWMLKKYDFSYKKNFNLIALTFITIILVSAAILEFTGLNDVWMSQGPMRRFNQRYLNQDTLTPTNSTGRVRGSNTDNQGQGRGKNRLQFDNYQN